MKGGIRFVKVVDEVEEVCDGRWDGKVAIVEARFGADTNEGGNGKEPSGGKGKRVKTENIAETLSTSGA